MNARRVALIGMRKSLMESFSRCRAVHDSGAHPRLQHCSQLQASRRRHTQAYHGAGFRRLEVPRGGSAQRGSGACAAVAVGCPRIPRRAASGRITSAAVIMLFRKLSWRANAVGWGRPPRTPSPAVRPPPAKTT